MNAEFTRTPPEATSPCISGSAPGEAVVTAAAIRSGVARENVAVDDAPRLLAGLRPMPGTLLRGSNCQILLHRIERDLRS